MCSHVEVRGSGDPIYCETLGELSDALGLPMPQLSLLDNPAPTDCLCTTNWQKVAARSATPEEGWPWPDYIIERDDTSIEAAREDSNG